MSAETELKQIYKDAYCIKNAISKIYVVYKCVFSKKVLGSGHTSKIAYTNALNNINK